MKTLRILFLISVFALMPYASLAQGRGVVSPNPSLESFGNNTLTVQVYPVIFSGYGLEYTRNIYRQKHWLKVNGAVYFASRPNSERQRDIRQMLGGSVGVAHQFNFFEIPSVGFRTYFQWGLNYTYLDIENVVHAKTHIEKFGLDAAIGFRQNIAKPLFFDFYIGYGQRWKIKKIGDDSAVGIGATEEARWPGYDKNMFGYGYTGPMLVVGLNIGFLF